MARDHAAIRARFPLDATLLLVSGYKRVDGIILASRTVRNFQPRPFFLVSALRSLTRRYLDRARQKDALRSRCTVSAGPGTVDKA